MGHTNGNIHIVSRPDTAVLTPGRDFRRAGARGQVVWSSPASVSCPSYVGQPGEQATMFLLDPSGNALELKSFKRAEHVFTA